MSAGYGAGLTVPGTGMLLNNALGEPELNKRGLHRLVPGTRLASNMAPTTGRTADGRVLAIGSPGADRITTALMQVLGQGCLHGADLQHAIDAPRLHVRFEATGEAVVEHESDPGIAAAVAAGRARLARPRRAVDVLRRGRGRVPARGRHAPGRRGPAARGGGRRRRLTSPDPTRLDISGLPRNVDLTGEAFPVRRRRTPASWAGAQPTVAPVTIQRSVRTRSHIRAPRTDMNTVNPTHSQVSACAWPSAEPPSSSQSPAARSPSATGT